MDGGRSIKKEREEGKWRGRGRGMEKEGDGEERGFRRKGGSG